MGRSRQSSVECFPRLVWKFSVCSVISVPSVLREPGFKF